MEREMFKREQASAMYHPIPYFLCKFFSEAPLNVLFVALITFITYFTTGLSLDEWWYMFAVFACLNIINFFSIFEGLWLGTIAPLTVAIAVVPIITCF
jgi:ABC-type multidrug transport system permease subunit